MPSIVVAGAGAAGLSFAYYLSKSGADTDFTCTLIDPDCKDENDRTWAFWGGPFDFDHLVEHRWDQIRLRRDSTGGDAATGGGTESVVRDAAGYRYIPADRFYRHCREQLEQDPRITFLRGRVEQIARYDSHVAVSVRDLRRPAEARPDSGYREIEADYVVESIFGPARAAGGGSGGRDAHDPLRQSFVGWEVRTRSPQWDPSVATLMEFPERSEQQGFEFFYVLPVDPSRALIEYTTVGEKVPRDGYLEERVEAYLDELVGVENWSLARREKGTIPLYDDIAPAIDGRIIRLGVVNGAARPSTGYAFRAISESSKALAQAFAEGQAFSEGQGFSEGQAFSEGQGLPLSAWQPPHVRGRPRFYDHVFLELLRREPGRLPGALVQMFRGNTAETVFRFLEGRSRLFDELRIVWSLPWMPFLRALFRWRVPHLARGSRLWAYPGDRVSRRSV